MTNAQWKALLSAAATLVLVGTAVGVALDTEMATQEVTCPDWCSKVAEYGDVQDKRWIFLGVAGGVDVADYEAVEDGDHDRLLGVCAGGTCTIEPSGCGCAYTYTYTKSPLVAGWRVVMIFAHKYILGGWKKAVVGDPDLKFLADSDNPAPFSGLWSKCRVHFSKVECTDLLARHVQFLMDDGTMCMGSSSSDLWHYGSGHNACPTTGISVIGTRPKTIYGRKTTEVQLAAEVWTAAELDTP